MRMIRTAVLLAPGTDNVQGRIKQYRSDSGSTEMLTLDLYEGNPLTGYCTGGTGKTTGYGMDTLSALVHAALDHACLLPPLRILQNFTFGYEADREDAVRYCRKHKCIPVYAGAGKTEEALGIFFTVVFVSEAS